MRIVKWITVFAVGVALTLSAQNTAWGQEKKDEKKPAPTAPPAPAPKPAEMKPKEGQPPAAQPSEEEMKAMMAAGAPGAHHEFFKNMVGQWKTTNKMFQGPETTISEGTSEFELVMGGRFVKQNYQGTFMGMPFEGSGYMGYDNMTKKHTGLWIDNMGTGMYVSEGTSCDAEHKQTTSVGSYTDPMTGQPAKSKDVFKMVDKDTMTFTMFRMGADGKEQPEMEITYKRM